jgi:hypothetical protein
MNNFILILTLMYLSGCAGWTVDAKIVKYGDDTCQVAKSKIKFCRRFDWPN